MKVKKTGSVLYLRVLSDDSPEEVGNTIAQWVTAEMREREYTERDTEIKIVIGMEVN